MKSPTKFYFSLCLVAAFSVSAVGCGDAYITPDLHITMRQGLAASVTKIELMVVDGSHDCVGLRVEKETVRAKAGLCLAEKYDGTPTCYIARVPIALDKVNLKRPISIYAPEGKRTIIAFGVDAQDATAAFACAGPLTLAAGKKVSVDLELK